MTVKVEAFARWMAEWRLTADGEPFGSVHGGAALLPVKVGFRDLGMLKVGFTDDERRGGAMMNWWEGRGAAPVLAFDDTALLMVRASATWSLADIARDDDDKATRIICATVKRLHGPSFKPPPPLPPLARMFTALQYGLVRDSRLTAAWEVATELLETPEDPVVLHGDIHHDNILDFGPRGWMAIDPWGYRGERAYDYANLFKNPDLPTMNAKGALQRRLALVAETAQLDPKRLLRWIYAHAGLSAAWSLEDDTDPERAFALLYMAGAELGI